MLISQRCTVFGHAQGRLSELIYRRWHDVITEGFADINATKYTQQHHG